VGGAKTKCPPTRKKQQNELEKYLQQFGDYMNKVGHDTGEQIEKAIDDFRHGLDQKGHEILDPYLKKMYGL